MKIIGQVIAIFAAIAVPVAILVVNNIIKRENDKLEKQTGESNKRTLTETNRLKQEMQQMIEDYLKPFEGKYIIGGK